jgi:hypothetical protein
MDMSAIGHQVHIFGMRLRTTAKPEIGAGVPTSPGGEAMNHNIDSKLSRINIIIRSI